MSKAMNKHFDKFCPKYQWLLVHFKYCTYQMIITEAVNKTEPVGSVCQIMCTMFTKEKTFSAWS